MIGVAMGDDDMGEVRWFVAERFEFFCEIGYGFGRAGVDQHEMVFGADQVGIDPI